MGVNTKLAVAAGVALVGGVLLGLGIDNARADMVLWWDFNDQVTDQSGTGNNGTVTNLTYSTHAPSMYGMGKSGFFNDTAYVNVESPANLDFSNANSDYTLMYFFDHAGYTDAGTDRLTSRNGFSFETAVGNANGLAYYGSWAQTGAASALPASGWTHIAWVNSAAGFQLFENGSLVYTKPAGAREDGGSGRFRVGANYNAGAENIQGYIDDVAWFNAALSPTEVQTIAQNGIYWGYIMPEPGALALLALTAGAGLARRRRG